MIIEKIIRRVKKEINKKTKSPESFRREFDLFNSLDDKKRFSNDWDFRQPCLNDNTGVTHFDAHYIYHPAWAARVVKKINPEIHYDISSTLHFATQLSAFVPTKFFDFRPARLMLSNLDSGTADLNNLPFESDSIYSISCMHTIEHIGLGRYGDKIDPDGDLKAFSELKRIVQKNGNLLIVVPLGKPMLRFNAHRIYSYEMIIDIFSDAFDCKEFAFVNDLGEFKVNEDPLKVKYSSFGCGCFWFIKK